MFVGSVFSPYYAWQRRSGPGDPEDHCAFNIALYGDAGKRWTMTERGRPSTERDSSMLQVGPSSVRWHNDALEIRFDERAVPLPRRVRGTVRVRPQALSGEVMSLDAAGRHVWGPIAPRAAIEVTLDDPQVRWEGEAYLDANAGSEPIDRPFLTWDWSRAHLQDGSTAVIYDVRPRQGPDRVLALRMGAQGGVEHFDAGQRAQLPNTLWGIARHLRVDDASAPRIQRTLEDTPFYSRSLVQGHCLGEPVVALHESISMPRLTSLPVQMMLPWRMPRRR